MALISSVGFDPTGQEIAESIYNLPRELAGALSTVFTPGYVASGPQPVFNRFNASQLSLRSASIAYDKAGDVLQDFVANQGVATQYMSLPNNVASQIVLGRGVESISVAFEPDGTGISDVVYEDGSYYEFTSTGGSTLVASNVVSASVAIDSKGDKLQDYVTADEVLHEISSPAASTPGGTPPDPTTATLGTNVVSSGIGFDGNGGVVRAVVFSNGSAFQYDYAGSHSAGQLFQIITQHILGSTNITFNQTTGEEYATVTFPQTGQSALSGGTAYLYNSSGSSLLGPGNLSTNYAFGPKGDLVRSFVDSDGSIFQSIIVASGGFIPNSFGAGVQSYSVAFDAQGNEVADVVYWNGEYYEVTASGTSTLIASDVVSASVAIDKAGDKLQDYVTADGVAHEISSPAPANPGGPAPTPTTTTLGTNVVSISVAFDGNGGIARSVLFTDGLAYQYDYAGQHLQGQVFNPLLYNPKRLSLTAGLTSY